MYIEITIEQANAKVNKERERKTEKPMMSWQTAPDDIMEKVLQRMGLSDRIRFGAVCKSWGSIAIRKDFRSGPQFPWLVCPDGDSGEFLKLSSHLEEKEHKLKLPDPVRGAWFCASSKGWLVMIKEDGLNSRMYLFNPISRALHQLPPLKTIPSFHHYVKSDKWKDYGALFFCIKVVLSTSDVDSQSCIVAARFHHWMLGLCRPGDRAWSLFPVSDYWYEQDDIADIMFSSGVLYALVSRPYDPNNEIVIKGRTLNLLGDNNYAVELKLIYDKSEEQGEHYMFEEKAFNWLCYPHLVESTTRNEVLVVHQMQDYYYGQSWLEEFFHHKHDYWLGEYIKYESRQCYYEIDDYIPIGKKLVTAEFRVYKLDTRNGKYVRVHSFEDKILFMANNGCLSLPQNDFKSFEGNCILFATNNILANSPDKGTFYFDDGQILREPSTQCDNKESVNITNPHCSSVKMSLRSRFSWFIPSYGS